MSVSRATPKNYKTPPCKEEWDWKAHPESDLQHRSFNLSI